MYEKCHTTPTQEGDVGESQDVQGFPHNLEHGFLEDAKEEHTTPTPHVEGEGDTDATTPTLQEDAGMESEVELEAFSQN